MLERLEDRKLFSTVVVAPAAATEPADGATAAATFTATLKAASAADVTLSYATADRTAKAGTDYTATTGSITIPAGSTTGTFTVPVLADDTSEAAETFVVRLTVSAGNRVNRTAVATIADGDPPPTVTVSDAVVAEPAAGARSTASVTVDLANPSTRPVVVILHTVDDTATAGTDYVAAQKRVTIRPGQTSATVTFTVRGDAAVEADEVFDVVATRATNATLDAALPASLFGRVVIRADAVTPTLTVSDATAVEGDTATFAVSLSAATDEPVSFRYATVAAAATAADFTAANAVVTIPAGATTATITVPTTDDATVEDAERFTLALTGAANATLSSTTATGTIVDDDAAPTLSVANVTTAEGDAGTKQVTFTVSLSAAASRAVTVNYATADGTATAGTDYAAAAGTLTFAAGQTTATVAVTVDGDATYESDETFTLNLSDPTNATLATAAATATIANDDAAQATLSVAAASVAEGAAGATTPLTFTVTLSSAQASAVTVHYATSDGTATAGTDYTAAAGTLTFAAGTTTQTVTVPVIGDATTEADEELILTLSTPTGAALGTATAVGTIINDDAATIAPVVNVAGGTVVEGNSGTATLPFTVTLSAAQATAVTVAYATADGTATAGTDYAAASGTLTFAAGETTKTVNVTVNGDATVESDETVRLTLSSPSGALLGTASATGTITNDDSAGGTTSGGTTRSSDNLADAAGGVETVTGSEQRAASFNTGSAAVTLTTVTLPIAMTTAGTLKVSVYTDAGLQPGTLVGTLTAPSAYSAAGTAFTGSVALSADTAYWVVVQAVTGSFDWTWTSDSTGTGTGYTGEWATSGDAGATWYSSDTFPLQMGVTVA